MALGHVIGLHPVCGVSKIISQRAAMTFDGAISQRSAGGEQRKGGTYTKY